MKKPNARQRILDTAADLFTERGYAVVGINEIIAKADTAKASFYHHFPSKENLCETWLEETHERSDERHDAILAADGDAREKIVNYFKDLKVWLKDKDYRGCPYTNTAASMDHESPKINEQVELHKLSIRDFFIELAREMAPAGSASRHLGTTLFLLYSGATTEAQNLGSAWPVDSAIESIDVILESYGALAA